jgi:hypothetical protein
MMHDRESSKSRHPTNRPTLSALSSRLDHVLRELEVSPGRVTESWAANELNLIAEQMFRVASYYRHGERG